MTRPTRVAASAAALLVLLFCFRFASRDADDGARGAAGPRAPAPAVRAPKTSDGALSATSDDDSRPRPPSAASSGDDRPAPATPRPARLPTALPTARRRILFPGAAPRGGDPGAVARALLDENADALGLRAIDGSLALLREFDSPGGRHVRFVQTLDGLPVLGTEVSAHVTADGRPLLVRAELSAVDPPAPAPRIDAEAAFASAAASLADDETLAPGVDAPHLSVLPEPRAGPRLGRVVWVVEGVAVAAGARRDSLRILVDAATGAVVRCDTLTCAADGEAVVFDPNPVFASRNPSIDPAGDRNTKPLRRALTDAALPDLDGSGFLRGPFADVSQTSGATQRASLDWSDLTRSDPAFEEVMCYFHADRAHRTLSALGHGQILDRAQVIDARGDTSAYFDGDKVITIAGGGKPHDGEDGDVITHEYGHAIQHDQVDGWGTAPEGRAMGEGFSDFFAVHFHRSGDPAYDPLVASWGHSGFSPQDAEVPHLRRVDGSKRYPIDLEGEEHADGEIWSRFLWDLRREFGADAAMNVALESHNLLSPAATFADGVDAVIAANRSLRSGDGESAIVAAAEARGILRNGVRFEPEADRLEPNDDEASATPATVGEVTGLTLGPGALDQDWFVVDVPAMRVLDARLRTDSPAVGSFNFEFYAFDDADSTDPADAAPGPGEASLALGADGGPVHVVAAGLRLASYDLVLTTRPLPALRRGRTVSHSHGGNRIARFRIRVSPADAAERRRQRIDAAADGLFGIPGTPVDVEVRDPAGATVVAFGDGATDDGASVRFRTPSAGDWLVSVRARPDTGGINTYTIRLR